MRNLLLTFLLLVLGLFSTVSAQVNGEFRSTASGNWQSSANWEVYNSSTLSWAPAVTFPNSISAVATVQSGHTMTLSATVTIKTLNLNGVVVTSGTSLLSIYYTGSIVGGSTTAYVDGPLAIQVRGTGQKNY